MNRYLSCRCLFGPVTLLKVRSLQIKRQQIQADPFSPTSGALSVVKGLSCIFVIVHFQLAICKSGLFLILEVFTFLPTESESSSMAFD